MPAVEQWRYRNKLEYSFGDGRRTGRSCAASTRRAGSTRSSRSTTACSPPSAATPPASRCSPGRASRASARWDRRDQRGLLRNLVVREGRRTGELQVRLVTSPGAIDNDSLAAAVDCEGLFWTQAAGRSARARMGGETKRIAGSKRLREQLGDLEFLISPEAFFQTNTEMAEVLYGAAIELAELRGAERVFDLYCGIGTIGLSLASRAREVVGVEIVEPAVADAIDNARRNEITNASLLRRRHPARDARPRRAGGEAGRRRDRPAARRPVAEGRAPDRRGRAEADRLRLLQPDDARAERGAARRGRLRAPAGAPRRHVPADAAHRVRRACWRPARPASRNPDRD